MREFGECESCRMYRQTLADINREMLRLMAALRNIGIELPGDLQKLARESDEHFRKEGL